MVPKSPVPALQSQGGRSLSLGFGAASRLPQRKMDATCLLTKSKTCAQFPHHSGRGPAQLPDMRTMQSLDKGQQGL